MDNKKLFIETLIDLITNITLIANSNLLRNNKSRIINEINKNKIEVISKFIQIVFIDNDSFIYKKILSNDMESVKISMMSLIDNRLYKNKIKEIWEKMSDENKLIVREYILNLSHYALNE